MANNLVTSCDPARTNSELHRMSKCVMMILFGYLLIKNWRFLQSLDPKHDQTRQNHQRQESGIKLSVGTDDVSETVL